MNTTEKTAKELAVDAHLERKYLAHFHQKKIGGILNIPENILTKQEAKQYLYEIDDKLNIYLNGVKHKVVELPTYAIRPFIMMDIIISLSCVGISPLLLQVFNNDGEEIVKNGDDVLTTKRAVELLTAPKSKSQQQLEQDLFNAIDNYIIQDNRDLVTDDISEGFEIIVNILISRINNENTR